MISTRHRFIYLHAPKTGGNSIQTRLLPLSDDRKTSGGIRDGIERFEIEGPVTPDKHATLAAYAGALGRDMDGFHIAISVRHPFERAVSFYLSDHRWMRKNEQTGALYRETPWYTLEAFKTCLDRIRPMTHFLTVGGVMRTPDSVIRFETLRADYRAFVDRLQLPVDPVLPHHNRSADPELQAQVLTDREARALVTARYRDDFDAFGYER